METQHSSVFNPPSPTSAALVCEHVLSGGRPILLAVRDEPEAPEDSGWQFTCGGDESAAPAVLAVLEVVALDPSIEEILGWPAGVTAERPAVTAPWRLVDASDEPGER